MLLPNLLVTLSGCATLVDFAGSILIGIAVIQVLTSYVLKGGSAEKVTKLQKQLAAYLVLALSFKTGAGLIRSINVATWHQFLPFLSIVALRFFLGQVLKKTNA